MTRTNNLSNTQVLPRQKMPMATFSQPYITMYVYEKDYLYSNCVLDKFDWRHNFTNTTFYQDELTTVGYSIPDEIPTTCFQLCELV